MKKYLDNIHHVKTSYSISHYTHNKNKWNVSELDNNFQVSLRQIL